MPKTIVALPGDGIGKEVTQSALQVLRHQTEAHGLDIEVEELPVGGTALARHGDPLPEFVLEACRRSAVVLLGAVGDPAYDDQPPERRPERAILQLRKELGLYANLRPITTYEALLEASSLKPQVVRGVDILIVRELTGGIYFGQPRGQEERDGARVAYNTEVYYDWEVERIAHTAFQAARLRGKQVVSVDKSNVLEASRLWRSVVDEVAQEYPEVELSHMLVDNCAMQLVRSPGQFDVMLTNNMFGDILSDEAAMLTGSLGMLPSASLGRLDDGRPAALFEPVHGSAPDIAGKGLANPLAAIASAALLLRHSLAQDQAAREIEGAVGKVLQEGWRSADLASSETPRAKVLGTRDMTEQVLQKLKR
ncbi:MAG TPA: 3-isopropylmalate dehydrogenase [Acidobacteriota bacterium]|nr:3-isopropylmalate dehydrogenase [Acidobacteriota bacterium]